jgi:gluconokinase
LVEYPKKLGSGVIIVVMGVTGAGKTTVGRLLARELGWEYVEGDDFHSEANVAKMRRGIPLGEEDRQPWLESLRAELGKHDAEGQNIVLACSALKRDYRKMLTMGPGVRFVYLKGDAQRITERLRARQGHFAGEKILAGQFADLEEPDGAVVVDIDATPEAMVREIREKLRV